MTVKRDIWKLEKGIFLKDGKTRPAKVKKVGRAYQITIHEGKNRIVRRMFGKLGKNVTRLQRIRIGSLTLSGLKPGKYRFLREKELAKVF